MDYLIPAKKQESMKTNEVSKDLRRFGTGIGVGVIAGLAGTLAVTVSQLIEMRITKRKEGVGPANAVEKTLDIHPEPGTKKQLAHRVHWTYGTLWGAVRGLFCRQQVSINGWRPVCTSALSQALPWLLLRSRDQNL